MWRFVSKALYYPNAANYANLKCRIYSLACFRYVFFYYACCVVMLCLSTQSQRKKAVAAGSVAVFV